jgi:hypothetical protein
MSAASRKAISAGPPPLITATRKLLYEGGTTGPKLVVTLASTTPMTALDVDMLIDRKDY